MTAATLRMDLEQTRVRVRWTMSMSAGFHALLLLWLIFHHVPTQDQPPITEITLVEPGNLAPGQAGEQWGTITFRYRLSSAG